MFALCGFLLDFFGVCFFFVKSVTKVKVKSIEIEQLFLLQGENVF